MHLTAVIILLALELAVLARVMLRSHRDPAARIAWVAVILALPVVGIIAYVFFGEVNIGRRRVERLRELERRTPQPAPSSPEHQANLCAPGTERCDHLFAVG